MRIVNQTKDWSYEFSNITVWLQDNVIYANVNGSSASKPLGFYESSDRAKEVFEEIHRYFYSPLNSVDLNSIMAGDGDNSFELFYMPEV